MFRILADQAHMYVNMFTCTCANIPLLYRYIYYREKEGRENYLNSVLLIRVKTDFFRLFSAFFGES